MTGRRSRSLNVVSSHRTGVESVGRETSDCERSRLGGELGKGGGGGGAGEGVARDNSILLGDRWRRPGKHYFSLSSNCYKLLWGSCWDCCTDKMITN